jgi:hypothetical protein
MVEEVERVSLASRLQPVSADESPPEGGTPTSLIDLSFLQRRFPPQQMVVVLGEPMCFVADVLQQPQRI